MTPSSPLCLAALILLLSLQSACLYFIQLKPNNFHMSLWFFLYEKHVYHLSHFAVCCSINDLALTQTRDGNTEGNDTRYILDIVNVGSSPVEQIHVYCGEFNPEKALNYSSDIMRKTQIHGDCLMINGGQLKPLLHIIVQYINAFMYEMHVAMYRCHDWLVEKVEILLINDMLWFFSCYKTSKLREIEESKNNGTKLEK